jgi:hypothetical protein
MYSKGNTGKRASAIIISARGSGGGRGGGQCELFLLGHYPEIKNYYIPVIYPIRVMRRVFSVGVQHIELHVQCAARTMCCTTLFYMLALTMMSPTTLELCVLLTCNALLAICTVHGHFQLCWTLQLIKAPRISMCTFESSCQPSITLLTCMRLRFQCSIGTLARSCSKWLYLSWTFFTPVGRFIYLVCLLMELAT